MNCVGGRGRIFHRIGWKEVVSELNILLRSGLKSSRKKSFFFLSDFALQKMVETMHFDGLETSGRRVYHKSLDVFDFFRFGLFFPFLFFCGFCVFLVHPTGVSVLLSALVEKFDVSRMRDFFKYFHNF